jgi:hypothetical protein
MPAIAVHSCRRSLRRLSGEEKSTAALRRPIAASS